jgi:hypothetical protein
LLRSKANFGILEGFLSELLKEGIIILDVLESEAITINQTTQNIAINLAKKGMTIDNDS